MARLFDDGSSEYLTNNAAVLTATPITMACWFNSNDSTIRQELISLSDTAGDTNFFSLVLMGADPGDLIRADIRAGSGAAAETLSGYSTNTLHHGCAVFTTPTNRAVYIDGGNKGTDVTDLTPAGIDATTIGCLRRTGVGQFMSGSIAEPTIWNVGLTDAEIAILAAGYSPLFVRPQNLLFYAPLIRGLNDKVGGLILTATGTTVSAHPPIIYPANVQVGVGEAAVPPVGITVLAAAYLRSRKRLMSTIPGID